MNQYKEVVIVAGHGAVDPGAIAEDGTTEREIVKAISKELVIFLKVWDEKRVYSFGVQEGLTLDTKIFAVNKYCGEKGLNYLNSLLVSIHADWRGAKEGVGAYHYTGSSSSKVFAQTILERVSEVGSREVLYNKADKESRYKESGLGIIQRTAPLACLIEVGSLRADEDQDDGLELLKNPAKQKEIARKIFEGILEFMGEDIPAVENEPHIRDSMQIITKEDIGSLRRYYGRGEKFMRQGVAKCDDLMKKL